MPTFPMPPAARRSARRLTACLLVALLAPAALGQTFTLTATQPADFAAGVPLATELRFTFSEALDAAALPPLVVLPTVDVAAPALSADGRTVAYAVTLAADTRYVALLPFATAASGARLARPAALNLTTSAQAGPLTVRGTVSDPAGGAVDGSLVALATADLATGAVQLVALRVLDSAQSSQAYALGPVPIGLYLAAAVRLPGALFDPASTTGPALGFYDANGDGTPDPVLLPFNVNVALAPLPTSTAGAFAAEAAASAEGALPGAALVAIPPQTVDAGGAAAFWTYSFAAGDARVSVVQLGAFSLPVPDALGTTATAALPQPFVDTDAAVAAADAAGGAAFRAQHAGQTVTVTAGTVSPPDAPVAVWRVVYTARDAAGVLVAALTVDVDLVTGAVIPIVAAADGPAAPAVRLAVEGANPSRGAVGVRLTLPAGGAARLTVVDARGRLVAVLSDGALAAGETRLSWPARVPAGVYWLRLDAAGQRATVPVTVMR